MALPAYDQCIKASHVFNLLDARGVISVTERQSYILRVRELAKACGEAWVHTEAGGRGVHPPLEGEGRSRSERGGVTAGSEMVKRHDQRLQTQHREQTAARTRRPPKTFFGGICGELNVEGSHFRRQVVIGPYIADFACLSASD